MDLEEVSKAWLKEYYRTCKKVFIDGQVMNEFKDSVIPEWHKSHYERRSLERTQDK